MKETYTTTQSSRDPLYTFEKNEFLNETLSISVSVSVSGQVRICIVSNIPNIRSSIAVPLTTTTLSVPYRIRALCDTSTSEGDTLAPDVDVDLVVDLDDVLARIQQALGIKQVFNLFHHPNSSLVTRISDVGRFH